MKPDQSFKFYLMYFFLMIVPCAAWAQDRASYTDTVKSLINVTLANETNKLFVHYDKTTYLPNETIWFTAYLLNDDTLVTKQGILSVVLVKNGDRTIAVQKKFVVTGATSSGSILIPDSVLAGDYSVIAYTNHFIKGQPDVLFTQRIAIKRVDEADVKAKVPPAKAGDFTSADSARIDIKFYPEGGDLVANLPAYVGWEAKDGTGAKLKLKAVLLKDGEFIDTVETSASGMGRFFINPKPGSKYMLAVPGVGTQSTFDLPLPVDKGVALTVPSAIVRDTLVLKVAATLTGHIHIVVHNTRRAFYVLTNVDPEKGKIFKIALDSLPRGLAAVTVYNENMRPCAERIFFAHDDRQPAVSIKAGPQKYGKRQKVTLKLGFNSNTDTLAVVSVACVQANRIDRRYVNNIDNYGFLEREINSSPVLFNDNIEKGKDYLEDVLLIKGWRRYKNDPLPVDTQSVAAPQFTGTIKVNGKPPKKPMTLTLMGNSGVSFINTDKQGHFCIPEDDLVAADDKVFALFATGDDAFNTRISLRDPFEQVNRSVALKLSVYGPDISSGEKFTDPALLFARDKIQLKEVKINGRPIDERFNPSATLGMHKNACGDYICLVGALNCPYPGHTYKTSIPIKGHRYIRHVGERHDDNPFIIIANIPFVYEGCDTKNHSLIRFGGLNLNKEYYQYTETDANNSEPLYNSTLYWGNQVRLAKGKQTEVSFYTGDVSGKYSIIVQGVTSNGVVYNEEKFEVVK